MSSFGCFFMFKDELPTWVWALQGFDLDVTEPNGIAMVL